MGGACGTYPITWLVSASSRDTQIVVTILFGAMFLTRRRNYSILRRARPVTYSSGILDDPKLAGSTDSLLPYDSDNDVYEQEPYARFKHLPKRRRCCGAYIQTPNSSRFKDHIHSRILQKFPFLIEMFYWVINYAFYRMTSVVSQNIFAGEGYWEVAQADGLAVLRAEHQSWLSFLFPIRERDVQQWFMNGHQDALTALNRTYALIHIPGTVG
jgi:hypothetical protein